MTLRRIDPAPLAPRVVIHPSWCVCAECTRPAPSAPHRAATFRIAATTLAAGILTGMALSAIAAWATGGPSPLVVFGL